MSARIYAHIARMSLQRAWTARTLQGRWIPQSRPTGARRASGTPERYETLDEMIGAAQKSEPEGALHQQAAVRRQRRRLGAALMGAIAALVGALAYRRLYERQQPYPRSVRAHLRRALYAERLGGSADYIQKQLLAAMDRLNALGYGTGSRQMLGALIQLAEALEARGRDADAVPVLEQLAEWALFGGGSSGAAAGLLERESAQAKSVLVEALAWREFIPPADHLEDPADRLLLATRSLQKLGDILWLRLQQPRRAEPFYAWSLRTLLGWTPDPTAATLRESLDLAGTYPSAGAPHRASWAGPGEAVSAVEKMASFYGSSGMQRPDLAIPLYLRAAQLLSQPLSNSPRPQTRKMLAEDSPLLLPEQTARISPCRRCVVLNNLADCYEQMGKPEHLAEAERWARAAAAEAEKSAAAPDIAPNDRLECLECRAVGLYNLGEILTRRDRKDAAKCAFRESLQCAVVDGRGTDSEILRACAQRARAALE